MSPAARRSFGAALLALGACAVHAAPARPEAGRHAVEFCVATLPKPPSCGAASVDVRTDATMRLRIDDIVYELKLRSSQVAVVVLHNKVRIDDFVAPYEWLGDTLQFTDAERASRYRIRFEHARTARR